MLLSRTTQSLLFAFSYILYYSPDFGVSDEMLRTYWDYGLLNFLVMIPSEATFLVVLPFIILAVCTLVYLLRQKQGSYSMEIIQMFVLPLQSFISLRKILMSQDVQLFEYIIHGLGLFILYGFCGMKIYSIKLRFDGNTLKGINRFRVIPSFLKLFRIILFTAGHLILDSVTTTLILLIFQIISFGIKYSYQIYEDPTFQFIGVLFEIYGFSSIIEYFLLTSGINGAILNIVPIMLIYISLYPPVFVRLTFQERILSIAEHLERRNEVIIFALIYLEETESRSSYLNVRGKIQLNKILQKHKIDPYPISNQTGPTQCTQQLEILWNLMKKMTFIKSIDESIFLCYFFQNLIKTQAKTLFFMFYNAKAKKNIAYFEEFQLDQCYQLMKKLHKETNSQEMLLETDKFEGIILQLFDKYIQNEREFLFSDFLNASTLREIKKYIKHRNSLKKEISEHLQNFKLLLPDSKSKFWFFFFFENYLEKKNVDISALLKNERNKFVPLTLEKTFIKKQENPVCICCAVQQPGKIIFSNSSFKNFVEAKSASHDLKNLNINTLLPHQWRSSHYSMMISTFKSDEIYNHHNTICLIETMGKHKLIEITLNMTLYVKCNDQLMYFLELIPHFNQVIEMESQASEGEGKVVSRKRVSEIPSQKSNKSAKSAKSVKSVVSIPDDVLKMEKIKKKLFMQFFTITKKEKIGQDDEISHTKEERRPHRLETLDDIEENFKYTHFKKRKDLVYVHCTSIFCYIGALLFTLALLTSIVSVSSSYFIKAITMEDGIYEFYISYFKDLALEQMTFYPCELMQITARDVNENFGWIESQSHQALENQWDKKEVFFLNSKNLVKNIKLQQLLFADQFQNPKNQNMSLPIHYLASQFSKDNDRQTWKIQINEEIENRPIVQERKQQFFFGQEGFVGNFIQINTKRQNKEIQNPQLFFRLTFLCFVLMFVVLFWFFYQYKKQESQFLINVRNLNKETLRGIKIQLGELKALLKKWEILKIQNIQLIQDSTIFRDDEEYDYENKRLESSDTNQKNYESNEVCTKDMVLFIACLFVILAFTFIVLSEVAVKTEEYMKSRYELMDGIQDYSELVLKYSKVFRTFDSYSQVYTNYEFTLFHKIMESIIGFNIQTIIDKLMEDEEAFHNLLYERNCNEYYECDNIPQYLRESLVNQLSEAKSALNDLLSRMEEQKTVTHEALIAEAYETVYLIFLYYEKILLFALDYSNKSEGQQITILSQILAYVSIICLFLVGLVTTIQILYESSIYQTEILSLSEPKSLEKTKQLEFYVNSLHHRTNFAQGISAS